MEISGKFAPDNVEKDSFDFDSVSAVDGDIDLAVFGSILPFPL